jgi:leucyl-tRNA synthetase
VTDRTIKRVGDDLERFSFNTAISAMMELVNELMRMREAGTGQSAARDEAIHTLVLVLAPFAPHLAEELWERLGGTDSVHLQAWPVYDSAQMVEEQVELVVQVNGKIRDRVTVAADADEETIKADVLSRERVQASFDGKTVQKVVVVPGRLVNIVVR